MSQTITKSIYNGGIRVGEMERNVSLSPSSIRILEKTWQNKYMYVSDPKLSKTNSQSPSGKASQLGILDYLSI